ncbi:MAG: class I SAM-dependent methyltransferase [Gemmatimonadaceae bacterium]
MTARSATIGVDLVLAWARTLPQGASLLDLGCGHGVPIAAALSDAGYQVYGIEASPTLAGVFRENLPKARVVCERVEDSSFFGRPVDGVLAYGLFFLLSREAQWALIPRVATAVRTGGKFLFTAPVEDVEWKDRMSGLPAVSLSAPVYRDALAAAGMRVESEYEDEGGNHFYDAVKS